jgi:carbamate kinase
MLVVAALGGNALLRRGERPDATTMEINIRRAVEALAPVARDHRLVVTHGNGPQVGLLAMQAAAYRQVDPYPLDVLGAETEGMIGYLIGRELHNQLPGREVATVLTQTLVSLDDPAFGKPEKFVGQMFDQGESQRVAAEHGWTMGRDGNGFRRVVASPRPLRIVEMPVLRRLVEADVLVVCAGGGGIPVALDGEGKLIGIEAVVDKDHASASLAIELSADALLLLTDVDGVYSHWGTPSQKRLQRIDALDIGRHDFAAGSIGPKVEAASRFVHASGKLGAIGSLEDAVMILQGRAGTRVDSR